MLKNAPTVAIFVMSCDRTYDVAQHFIAAFSRYWADCPYPVYFGVNYQKNHLKQIAATPLASEIKGWREETFDQLSELRRLVLTITHVLVFLDDFILSKKVDTELIRRIISDAVKQNVEYLLLRPAGESIWIRLKQRFMEKHVFSGEPCISIRTNHPYYSSLQVALWRIDHLQCLVERSDNIWAFERIVPKDVRHYSVLNTVLKYRHVVEKGAWDIGVADYCVKTIGWFAPGLRPKRADNIFERIVFAFRKWIFYFFGYSLMRLKKVLRSGREL